MYTMKQCQDFFVHWYNENAFSAVTVCNNWCAVHCACISTKEKQSKNDLFNLKCTHVGHHLQGVKKVRRHCNIPYNFIMNNNTILKMHTI